MSIQLDSLALLGPGRQGIELWPSFDPALSNFTAEVQDGVSEVFVRATAGTGLLLRINGDDYLSGDESRVLLPAKSGELDMGITIQVSDATWFLLVEYYIGLSWDPKSEVSTRPEAPMDSQESHKEPDSLLLPFVYEHERQAPRPPVNINRRPVSPSKDRLQEEVVDAAQVELAKLRADMDKLEQAAVEETKSQILKMNENMQTLGQRVEELQGMVGKVDGHIIRLQHAKEKAKKAKAAAKARAHLLDLERVAEERKQQRGQAAEHQMAHEAGSELEPPDEGLDSIMLGLDGMVNGFSAALDATVDDEGGDSGQQKLEPSEGSGKSGGGFTEDDPDADAAIQGDEDAEILLAGLDGLVTGFAGAANSALHATVAEA